MLTGCNGERWCMKHHPPQTNDSITYVEKWRDSIVRLPGDTSSAKYLVECRKTAEGYKAYITQLITQQQGEYLTAPQVVIIGDTLSTTTQAREREVHVQIRYIELKAVKAKVYVKVTNELTGLQNFLVWVGGIVVIILVLYFILKIIKAKFKALTWLPYLLLPVFVNAQTTHTGWSVPTSETPLGRDLPAYSEIFVKQENKRYHLLQPALKTATPATLKATPGAVNTTQYIQKNTTFDGSPGILAAYNPNSPFTAYGQLYLAGNGNQGKVILKAYGNCAFDNQPGSITMAMYPVNQAIGFQYNSTIFGNYGYQLDEWGFYPTFYPLETATYRSSVGIPTNHWLESHVDKTFIYTVPSATAGAPLLAIENNQVKQVPGFVTGSGSFTGNAGRVAIRIIGATAGDKYIVTATPATASTRPLGGDILTAYAKTDSLVVQRMDASNTANLSFTYIRFK